MSRQYKRVYELTIIPPDGEARVIKELRISFDITKSLLGIPNLANISIYNPSPDTLSALQKKYTRIILNAGYQGNLRLLFKGDIRNVFQMRKGVDRIVNLYAGDGERAWQNSTFNKTFNSSVTIRKVVEDILGSFSELTVGVIQGVQDIADKPRGRTLSGSSKDIMDDLAEEYGFNWSIQDGELQVVPDDEPVEGREAVLINSATGMIGTPTVTEIGADVTTLLNPLLLPNRAFKIESVNTDVQLGNLFFREVKKTSAEGFYKVQEVNFKGDSREGDWLSTVKGRSI